MIERLAKERVHPSWTVPGGVNAPLDPHAREKTLAELPAAMAIVQAHARRCGSRRSTASRTRSTSFSNFPTMYCGLVGPDGSLRLYDGNLRFVDADGAIVADQVRAGRLRDLHRRGVPRRTPTSRRPTTSPSAIPTASTAWARWRASTSPTAAGRRRPTRSSRSTAQRFGRIVQSGFHYHYARLIEATYALERMQRAARRPGHPRDQGPRPRGRQRARGRRASSRPRAAR